jgi:hypothetical protein
MVFSTIAFAAGAVMYWGVKTQASGFRIGTVGVILMIVGAAGLVISSIVFATSRRRAGNGAGAHTFDRQAVDAQGRSTVVHEEVR